MGGEIMVVRREALPIKKRLLFGCADPRLGVRHAFGPTKGLLGIALDHNPHVYG
jgi:hypothetical protein